MSYSPFIERLLASPNEATARRLLGALGIGVTTDAVPEGVVNLYFTDERAMDAIDAMLAEGANITLSYNDAGDVLTISAAGGGGGYSVAVKTASYTETIMSGGIIILADASAGSFVITLPTAVGNTSVITIKKTNSANTVTIDGAGAQTIDGGATAVITYQYASVTLVSDGANWYIT